MLRSRWGRGDRARIAAAGAVSPMERMLSLCCYSLVYLAMSAARPSRGSFGRDAFGPSPPVVAVLRQPAAGCFELPGIAPSLGRCLLHAGAREPVADCGPTGLVDALGVSSAGHGRIVCRDVKPTTAK
jgi:hypothetical protein